MCAEKRSVEVTAYAKVNLFLDVLRRREDGYHDIRSILVPVSLGDRIRIENAESGIETIMDGPGAVPCEGMAIGGSDNNLATKAGRLLKEKTGYPGGARIYLEKYVPVGGGLGGGSADAAAVLAGLNELWETGLSLEQLLAMAIRLGSDVPALLRGGAVCVEGMGEKVSPVFDCGQRPRAEWWLVLANPGFGVSTGDIYSRHVSSLTSRETQFTNMLTALREGDVAKAGPILFNALETTVFRKYPLLEMLVEHLRGCEAEGALLSGSGATVFALARDQAHAESIVERIRRLTGPWLWTAVVRTLPDGVIGSTRPFGG